MEEPKNLGKRGENIAMKLLEKKGYIIMEMNFHKLVGEVDIIAFDPKHNEYVFVEVKTRRSLKFGTPEEAVTQKKIGKIAKTGQLWLMEKRKRDEKWRIDMIAITIRDDKTEIDHLENIS